MAGFKVIYQTSSEDSVARNLGLDTASGEYLSFVDRDDGLEPEMYEELVPILEERSRFPL